LLFGFLMFQLYRFRYDFDTIFYITVAKLVSQGRFLESITGYWSPLISWIMSLAFIFKLPVLLLFKVFQFIAGAFFILGFYILLSRVRLSETIKLLTLLTATIITVLFSAWHTTADMLMYSILIYYLVLITSSAYSQSRYRGLGCGIISGLAFLAKHYVIFFFPLHFGFTHWLLYCYFQGELAKRKNIVRAFALGVIAFAIIAGSWIGVLSWHYKKFTIYKTPTFLFFYSPISTYIAKNKTTEVFASKSFLFELTNGKENGYLNSPDFYSRAIDNYLAEGHITQKDILIIIGANLLKNVYNFFCSLLLSSVFSVAILVLGITYIVFLSRKYPPRFILLIIISAIVIYYFGLIVIFPEGRYLFFANILLLLLGSFLLERLLRGSLFTAAGRKFLLICYFCSFIAVPLKNAIWLRYTDKEIHSIARQLKGYGIKGRLCSQMILSSYIISLNLESEFYPIGSNNILNEELDTTQLEGALKRYGIDYYLLWEGKEARYPFLEKYREVLGGKIKGIKVYSLKEPLLVGH